MADDDNAQPTGARNPARHEGVDPTPMAPPTPDVVRSDDNVGRRAEIVNGAVVGAGAGAGGGGGPEEFSTDPQGGGGDLPNRAAEEEAAGAERDGADRRRH